MTNRKAWRSARADCGAPIAITRRLCALALFAAGFHAVDRACAATADHDSRPLTAAEYKLFLPLACVHPTLTNPIAPPASPQYPDPYGYHCDSLHNYPDLAERLNGRSKGVEVSLTAIAYGSFSAAGMDEAYISYTSDIESHATLFGGGMLFRRQGGKWTIVTWIPAERRESCVTLPDAAPEEMLCLASDGHPDESSDSIFTTLTAQHPEQAERSQQVLAAERATSYKMSREVFAIRDNSVMECGDMHGGPDRMMKHGGPCETRSKDGGFLIEIKSLKRSHHPGAFAEALITYASPDAVTKACRATCYLDAKQQRGKAYFSLHGRTISVTIPSGLKLQSAFKP